MQFQKHFTMDDPTLIETFIQEQNHCYLVTHGENSQIHFGVFNPHYEDRKFYLHLNRKDEQVIDLMTRPKCWIVTHEFLSMIPSYWVDPKKSSAATAYYRYAEFECTAQILSDTKAICTELQKLMDHYQPEKGYQEMTHDNPTYKADFGALVIVKLTVETRRTKWKLGQNRSVQIRERVAQELNRRNQDKDRKTADEILACLQRGR